MSTASCVFTVNIVQGDKYNGESMDAKFVNTFTVCCCRLDTKTVTTRSLRAFNLQVPRFSVTYRSLPLFRKHVALDEFLLSMPIVKRWTEA